MGNCNQCIRSDPSKPAKKKKKGAANKDSGQDSSSEFDLTHLSLTSNAEKLKKNGAKDHTRVCR